MHFRADGTGRLCREHLDVATHQRRDDGDGEEHDSQCPHPLCHAAPEEHPVGQPLHVVDDARPRGGESRHRLKVRIGEIGHIAADEEGQRAKQAEDDPCERHQEVGVSPAKGIGGVTPHVFQSYGAKDGEDGGDDKRHGVILTHV